VPTDAVQSFTAPLVAPFTHLYGGFIIKMSAERTIKPLIEHAAQFSPH
jgi:hypothetical protein